ncbi:hypothetical protein [Chishuiella sp.]|uniref:hypothetical protein n=1 Tax=Chishuiella sp. TaxID=1969467 RepID=UPI0028A789F8|nr:hypothetical protein [Chishuiella sp.]
MLENEKNWILQNILSNVEEHNSAKLLRESLFKIIDGFTPIITASGAGLYQGKITPTSTIPSGITKSVFVVTEPGTYRNFGNVVLPQNSFGFIFWNGSSFSISIAEIPTPDMTAVNEAVNNLEKSIIPEEWFEFSQSESEIPFTLYSGQILTTGAISASNNWLRAEITTGFIIGKSITIKGLGNFDFTPKSPPYTRVAFYNSSAGLISKVDWSDGINSLTITPPIGCTKIGMQVDGGSSVGSSPNTSPFLNSLKINSSQNNVAEKIGIKADFVVGNSLSNTICFVNNNISVSGNGTINSPFKTINEALNYISNSGGTIVVSEGIYREVLNFSSLKNGDFKIIAKIANTVKIYGSQKIDTWTLSSGQNNTYQTAFTGTIPKGLNSRFDQMIFEDGNPSMPILNNEIHPLQKSLSFRLPFTPLIKRSSIAEVEANAGSFAQINGIVYIHPSNSTNPNTNGFSYEVIQRDLNTVKSAVNNDLTNIYLENLQFMFGKTALRFIGFNFVNRKNITVLANLDAGAIRDDTCNVYSINDEAGFCDSDGINGHFLNYTNYDKLTNHRSMSPTAIYINAWCHDNYDDGLSHHENHRVTLHGGLFEYNGDGGVRASNDANYDIYYAHARHNGLRTDRSIGEGFGVVNPILNQYRNKCKMNLFYCITEYNVTGIGAMGSGNIVNAYSCISRNNKDGELYAHSSSIINSYNTLGYNTDNAKLKVSVSSGIVNIFNSELIK